MLDSLVTPIKAASDATGAITAVSISALGPVAGKAMEVAQAIPIASSGVLISHPSSHGI